MTNNELVKHLHARVEYIDKHIMLPQSNEAKCLLDGKRKAFQYVLDLLEIKGSEYIPDNSEDKLRLIHDVVAEYIYNVDKTAVESMEEIIDIFGDADWFLGKETNNE